MIASHGFLDEAAKRGGRRSLPVRPPVERIELDMRRAQEIRKLSGERGLPAAARTNHSDTLEIVRQGFVHRS